MNSPLACLAALSAAVLTAVVPAQPPAAPANPEQAPATPSDSLSVWRERAARAEAWLRAQAGGAQSVANETMARARQELLGVEGPVSQSTLSVAAHPVDRADEVIWEKVGEYRFAIPQKPDQSAVLLVHGLDEPGSIWDELTPHLLDAGAIVIRLDYPNDQGLVASGADLAAALRRLRGLGIERVSIVAHSMGGLVAREVLTCESAYKGNGAGTEELPAVQRLIMCGTPNHGSPLAGMQKFAEAREQVYRRLTGTSADGAGLIVFTGDGNGEAGQDLCEGSAFLEELNARPHPLNVQMTTICGVVTPTKACEYLKGEAAGQWAGLLGAERADALTAQACAAVQTLGDGIVPAASTRLEGVADHVEINADHRSMLKRWTLLTKVDELRGIKTPPAEAIPVVLDRLGLKPRQQNEGDDPSPGAE